MQRENTKKSRIDIDEMSVPKGGGAYQGMGERISVQSFTGEAKLSVPIYTLPCRGVEPKIELCYSATAGNGPFGIGFFLNLPWISRSTSKHIPVYDDDDDVFTLFEKGDLVFEKVNLQGDGYTVRSYHQRYEEEFCRIEYWKKQSQSFWKIVDRNNAVSVFGLENGSQIANPNKPEEVFTWLLCSWSDDKGNEIKYSYNNRGLPLAIQYGNWNSNGQTGGFCFEIKFEYQTGRRDPFKRYNAGFLRYMDVLCTKIVMLHHAHEKETIVRETSFGYNQNAAVAMLETVAVTGYKEMGEGKTDSLKMPDTIFSYQQFCPRETQCGILKIAGGTPIEVNKNKYFMVDLDGEGAPGILYDDGVSIFYSRPIGNFCYGRFEHINHFPIHKDLSNPQYTLTSLEGNGKYQLIVRSKNINGFYCRENGGWGNFQPFEQVTNEALSPYAETADLQGDRQSHLMITAQNKLRYYPSLKTRGVGQPIHRTLPDDFPHISQKSHTKTVQYLEIFGDGLAHRVLIANGVVECYPNLGYGRFGEKVVMENAPYFEEGLDVNRLFFADIDGSGAVDFIYVYPDRVDIYFNQCGIGFSKPISFALPEAYTKMDHIYFADINGNGTNCMVFSKLTDTLTHYYYDFSCGHKPYMLTQIDCNTGIKTQLTYESSVSLFLKAREAGESWKMTSPFPVQTVVKKKEINEISKTVLETEYAYKDELYDYIENELKGFRFVEERERLYHKDRTLPIEDVRKKIWHFTQYDDRAEYDCSDSKAFQLDSPILDSSDEESAKKSLWGKIIREEFYDMDASIPNEIKQYRYCAVEVIHPRKEKEGSYFVHPIETLSSLYEGNYADPRIEHTLDLERDCYGNIVRKCVLTYPRRKNGSPLPKKLRNMQEECLVCETESRFVNQTEEQIWHLGILTEEKRYEYQGICNDGCFTLETLCLELDLARKQCLDFGIEYDVGMKQARLASWCRLFYWDDQRTVALPLGMVGTRALLHSRKEAVFPEKLHILDGFITSQELEEDGGYQRDSGYWWNPGCITHYTGATQFFQLCGSESPTIYTNTKLIYDSYALLPVTFLQFVTEACQNKTTAVIDYDVMQYNQITDRNNIVSQVLFNPLGQVLAATEYGVCCGQFTGNDDIKEYQKRPDSFENIIHSPKEYLQGMTSFFYYDFRAYQDRKQPITTVSVERGYDVSVNKEGCVGLTIAYWDGYNRNIEKRRLTEKGNWAVQNKAAYDKNGNTIILYPAYFSESYYYSTIEGGLKPTVSYYDWRNRLVKKESPDTLAGDSGFATFYKITEYCPWEERIFDENQTVVESEYYKKFIETYPKNPTLEQIDRRDALEKSVAFYGKPNIHILDGRGNKIADILDEAEETYVNFCYDVNGNVISVADARLEKLGGTSLRTYYDMRGRIVCTDSCDAGRSLQIENIFEKLVHSINGNLVHKKIRYDGLLRQTEVWISGSGLVERVEYGETLKEGQNRNLRGQVYKRYDQAGVEIYHSYSIRQKMQERTRRLCKLVEQPIDWTKEVALEETTLNESFSYNTKNQMSMHKTPDGVIYTYQFNCRGFLEKIAVAVDDMTEAIVESIYYCAGEKRTKIQYGNGVFTKYQYDKENARLKTVHTVRKQTGKEEVLQSLAYSYDPVGHVTRIRDALCNMEYAYGQAIKPYMDYTYDHFYRIQSAVGRELAGEENDFQSLVNYQRQYCYDYAGNLTKIRHSSPAKKYTVALDIDDTSNRLVSFFQSDERNEAQKITYDGCGNMLHLPHLRQMVWDNDGHLMRAVAIEREGDRNDEELYSYDAFGKRVRKICRRMVDNGKVEETEKLYLDSFCIESNTTGNKSSRSSMCITDGEAPIAMLYYENGSRRILYQLENHTKSVGMEMNEKAEIISAEEYFPFGGTALFWRTKVEAPDKTHRFGNKELDAVTGFYYFEARYYSASMGRMVSADSTQYIRYDQWSTINLYVFCNNDPINFRDPTGHCASPSGSEDPDDSNDSDYKPEPDAQIITNQRKGAEFAYKKFQKFKSQYPGAVQELSISVVDPATTKKTIVRVDGAAKDTSGNPILEEYKSSKTASFTKNQKVGYPLLETAGGTVKKGKGPFNTDEIVPPTKVQVVRGNYGKK